MILESLRLKKYVLSKWNEVSCRVRGTQKRRGKEKARKSECYEKVREWFRESQGKGIAENNG